MEQEPTLGEIARGLDRIEGKLDGWAADHEERIRRIERAMWILTGLAAAGATSGLGSIVQAVG